MDPEVESLLREAVAHHQAGRLPLAQSLYEEILRLDEKNPNALNLLGMVHHAEGRFEHASELVARAIAAAPTIPGFHNNLGTIRLAQRKCADAETHFRQAIELDPGDYVEAINNLAVALMGQGKMDDAIQQLVYVVDRKPNYASARNNLGNALRSKYLFREAVDCYRDAIAIKADHAEAWSNMASVLLEMKDLAGAEEACIKAIQLKPDAVSPHYTLGLVMEESGRADEAREHYEAASKLAPAATGLKFLLAALSGDQSSFSAAPTEFVASVFDHYADTFDRHLVGTLKYRGPELIHEAIVAAGVNRSAPLDIVDLGCGTGLCGPIFKPLARTLIGVDLSARMINRARERQAYDELLVEEMTTFLAARPNQFDLAISADVFEYFGDLAAPLSAVSHGLRAGGVLAFTVEKKESDAGGGYQLQPTRRYTHTLAYIRSLLPAAKLREVSASEATLRTQAMRDVIGLVLVLEKRSEF